MKRIMHIEAPERCFDCCCLMYDETEGHICGRFEFKLVYVFTRPAECAELDVEVDDE